LDKLKGRWDQDDDADSQRDRAHSFGNGSLALRGRDDESRNKYPSSSTLKSSFGDYIDDDREARKLTRHKKSSRRNASVDHGSGGGGDDITRSNSPVELSTQLSALQNFLIAQRQKETKEKS